VCAVCVYVVPLPVYEHVIRSGVIAVVVVCVVRVWMDIDMRLPLG